MPVSTATAAPSRFNMDRHTENSANDEEACCSGSYLSSRAAFCILSNGVLAPLVTAAIAAIPVASSAIGNAVMSKAHHEGYNVLDGVKGTALGSAVIVGGVVGSMVLYMTCMALDPNTSIRMRFSCNICGPSEVEPEREPEPGTTINLALQGIPLTAINVGIGVAGNALLKAVGTSNLSNKHAVIASSVGSGIVIGGALFTRAIRKLLCH